MRQVLVVVDDFYDDFASVRRRALEAEYEPAGRGNYGGRNSLAPYLTTEATRKLASLAGGAFGHLEGSGSGCFRTTREGERGKFDVHVDRAQLSAVVYLGLPEHTAGRIGTSFWRHRRTGSTGFPSQADAATYERLSSEIIVPDSNDRSQWELVLEASMAPNRLIMFPSKLFHSAHPGYGSDLVSSRLIQMFFLMRAS